MSWADASLQTSSQGLPWCTSLVLANLLVNSRNLTDSWTGMFFLHLSIVLLRWHVTLSMHLGTEIFWLTLRLCRLLESDRVEVQVQGIGFLCLLRSQFTDSQMKR